MATRSTIAQLFVISPIELLQQHMVKVHQAVTALDQYFSNVFQANWPGVERTYHRIGQLEHEADSLKMNIRLNLPRHVWLPVNREALLNLLAAQEAMINRTKDIAGLILGRHLTIPEELIVEFKPYIKKVIATSAQANTVIQELKNLIETGFRGRYVAIVENMVQKLDDLERETDQAQIRVRNVLLKLEQALFSIDVIFIYKIIDRIGDLADLAEKVGARLQVLLIN